jgi:hypothetical protein
MNFETLIQKLRDLLMFAIGFCYIIFGGFVIKEKWFLTLLSNQVAWLFGVLLIIYGAYRVYRAYRILKKESF